jgi:hypothetical protein
MATAALAPAVQPAVSDSWAIGQDVGQQIGTEGRDADDIGIAEVLPQPWDDGPLLTSPVPSGNASAIETTSLGYLGPDYAGVPVDMTPWPYYGGDPEYSENVNHVTQDVDHTGYDTGTAVTVAHDWDLGAPAALRAWGHPDTGDPVFQEYQMQSTDRQPVFSPNGMMVELPGSRNANVLNWYNNEDINTGIGYYTQETERAFYNTLAEVPGEYDGPGGQFDPDDRYSDIVYNDGGIPEAYVTSPDAPVAPVLSPAAPVIQDMGYGGSY